MTRPTWEELRSRPEAERIIFVLAKSGGLHIGGAMSSDASPGFFATRHDWKKDCDACRGCALGLCIALSDCRSAPVLSEPYSGVQAKTAVSRYCDSGDYLRDIEAVAAEALAWIEQRCSARRPEERLAIVMDLDETSLSNQPLIRRLNYEFVPPAWDEWFKSAQSPAIEPMLKLYHRSLELGLDVFFITGRREAGFHVSTEENLRRVGMGTYASLIMGRYKDPQQTNADAKAAHRAAIEAGGHVIIANIGDQESDLAGGHAERGFKVPSPFYFIP